MSNSRNVPHGATPESIVLCWPFCIWCASYYLEAAVALVGAAAHESSVLRWYTSCRQLCRPAVIPTSEAIGSISLYLYLRTVTKACTSQGGHFSGLYWSAWALKQAPNTSGSDEGRRIGSFRLIIQAQCGLWDVKRCAQWPTQDGEHTLGSGRAFPPCHTRALVRVKFVCKLIEILRSLQWCLSGRHRANDEQSGDLQFSCHRPIWSVYGLTARHGGRLHDVSGCQG